MSVKLLVLGGGIVVFFFGGGSADFIFMGAGIFLKLVCTFLSREKNFKRVKSDMMPLNPSKHWRCIKMAKASFSAYVFGKNVLRTGEMCTLRPTKKTRPSLVVLFVPSLFPFSPQNG